VTADSSDNKMVIKEWKEQLHDDKFNSLQEVEALVFLSSLKH
jgi:hypothetical protein